MRVQHCHHQTELIEYKSSNAPINEADDLEGASMLPDSTGTVPSAAPSGAATHTERAAPQGAAAAQQKVVDSQSSASVGVISTSAVSIIYNGESNPDEGDLKAPPTTQSALLARRREGGYVSGGLPLTSQFARQPSPNATAIRVDKLEWF